MIGELYPGEFEAMEHNGRMDALEQEPCEEELDFVQEHKKISCNLIVEPCEDCISRQAALGCCRNEWEEEVKIRLKSLPPVNPQEPKTGRWITTRTFMHDGEFYCDKCKCEAPNNEKWDYCPNCGCRMVEPQESEGQP